MKDESLFFIRKRVDEAKLASYGFTETDGVYCYQTRLPDRDFLLEVTVQGGIVQTKLMDIENECEYVLHVVSGTQGEFVGLLRETYEAVLADIRERCFVEDVFKSDSARAVNQYVADQYGTPLEFLWKRSPDNAIYRRPDNQKWYAVLLTVARDKLGLSGDGTIEIIDLRLPPEQMEQTVDHKRYFPGYHMNKKSWYTICLDGTVEAEELFRRIDLSYRLAGKK